MPAKEILTAAGLSRIVRRERNEKRAVELRRFFKTGPGEYGEGDRFLGITVPQSRALARRGRALPMEEVLKLLQSEWHEERLMALLIWIGQYETGSPEERKQIFSAYRRHTRFINNWDLVDLSAPPIVGAWLLHRDRALLREWVQSSSLWDRRIAMVATHAFIRMNEFSEALAVAKLLLQDREDLIHKAVGWMLREVGKRDQAAEEAFLRVHYRTMPRTMLRYAIERFPEPLRQRYLKGEVF